MICDLNLGTVAGRIGEKQYTCTDNEWL